MTVISLSALSRPILTSDLDGSSSSSRALRVAVVVALGLLTANCANQKTSRIDPKYGVSPSQRVVADGESVPKGGGYAKIGKPYVIAGETYTPRDMKKFSATGYASWYGSQFHGRMTANGEVFDAASVTAAHPTMPLPSYIRVTNMVNGRSIIARVNDRGPFHSKRLIDVSERVADALAFRMAGTARVKVDYIGPAPTDGSDDKILIASLTTDGSPASLRGDARAAIQLASNDQPEMLEIPSNRNADTLASIFANSESNAAASSEMDTPVLDASGFIPLPPVRNLTAQVNLIPSKPVLLASKPISGPSVQTASIPMPIPRPGGMFYAPASGFVASPAFAGLTPQHFVPMK